MKNNKTAYVNGVILTGEENMTPITGHNILTSGDRIIDIQPADASTEGYEIIDLNGAYIMPGLINLHVHIPGSGKPKKKQIIRNNPHTRRHIFGQESDCGNPQTDDTEKLPDRQDQGLLCQ